MPSDSPPPPSAPPPLLPGCPQLLAHGIGAVDSRRWRPSLVVAARALVAAAAFDDDDPSSMTGGDNGGGEGQSSRNASAQRSQLAVRTFTDGNTKIINKF